MKRRTEQPGGAAESLRQREMFPGGDPMSIFDGVGDKELWVPNLGFVLLPDGCKTLADAFIQSYATES